MWHTVHVISREEITDLLLTRSVRGLSCPGVNQLTDPLTDCCKNPIYSKLTLGDSFCNGTGPPDYLPSASTLNPLKTWYIQAQYFFALKCNEGGNVNVHFGE